MEGTVVAAAADMARKAARWRWGWGWSWRWNWGRPVIFFSIDAQWRAGSSRDSCDVSSREPNSLDIDMIDGDCEKAVKGDEKGEGGRGKGDGLSCSRVEQSNYYIWKGPPMCLLRENSIYIYSDHFIDPGAGRPRPSALSGALYAAAHTPPQRRHRPWVSGISPGIWIRGAPHRTGRSRVKFISVSQSVSHAPRQESCAGAAVSQTALCMINTHTYNITSYVHILYIHTYRTIDNGPLPPPPKRRHVSKRTRSLAHF